MIECLMLGAGHKKPWRQISLRRPKSNDEITWYTLDYYADTKPDFTFDLNRLEKGEDLPGGPYDEIHAYEVMEHFGRQGDFRGFFNTFNAIWRALKPGGLFYSSSPHWTSEWAWGDPGHTRIVGLAQIVYLFKEQYENDVGEDTPMSDYRSYVEPHWWKLVLEHVTETKVFAYVLAKEDNDT